MGVELRQQQCVIGNNEGVYVCRAPLPKLPSQVVDSESRPHLVTYLYNRPASVLHCQAGLKLGLLHGMPLQYRQTRPHPPRAST